LMFSSLPGAVAVLSLLPVAVEERVANMFE
jgi:hypothetical protein